MNMLSNIWPFAPIPAASNPNGATIINAPSIIPTNALQIAHFYFAYFLLLKVFSLKSLNKSQLLTLFLSIL